MRIVNEFTNFKYTVKFPVTVNILIKSNKISISYSLLLPIALVYRPYSFKLKIKISLINLLN